MKNLFAIAVVVCAFSSARADEFFGIDLGDASAVIAQAKAAERLQQLRDLGYKPSRISPLARIVGTTKTLDSREDCIINAVLSYDPVSIREGTEWPTVLFESDTDINLYREAVRRQYPGRPTTSFTTIYLPSYNVIYLADDAKTYPAPATLDEALAAEYARFIAVTQKDVRDPVKLDDAASQARAWYRWTYPTGTSSCRR